jgi:hypothetical protein
LYQDIVQTPQGDETALGAGAVEIMLPYHPRTAISDLPRRRSHLLAIDAPGKGVKLPKQAVANMLWAVSK